MIFFIGFILSTAIYAQSVQDLCGNTKPNSMLTSSLAKNSTYEWCYGGVCEIDEKSIERVKCVKQLLDDNDKPNENEFMVLHSEVHTAPNSVSHKSYGAFYRLYPGDGCYDECRPESKVFLGMNRGKKVGIEKDQCVKCMINQSVSENESYEVVGHNVTVYKGQQCYSLCRLPAGDYLDHRPYSSQCLSCIGAMGIKPVFEHLINMDGACFELREQPHRGSSAVPEQFCANKDGIYGTYFKKTSKFTFDSLVFGKPQECLEVDDKSGGNYYTRNVSMEECEPRTNDSGRGSNDKSSSSSSSRNQRGGATRN